LKSCIPFAKQLRRMWSVIFAIVFRHFIALRRCVLLVPSFTEMDNGKGKRSRTENRVRPNGRTSPRDARRGTHRCPNPLGPRPACMSLFVVQFTGNHPGAPPGMSDILRPGSAPGATSILGHLHHTSFASEVQPEFRMCMTLQCWGPWPRV